MSLEEDEPFLFIPLREPPVVSVLDELPVVSEVVLLPNALVSLVAPLFFFLRRLFFELPIYRDP